MSRRRAKQPSQEGKKLPPSLNGANGDEGRDEFGRFAKGNPGGPGNPHAADVGRQRARFFAALRDDDIDKALTVIRDVMGSDRNTDRLAAARELLDRVIGKPVQTDVLERIEALERAMAARAVEGNGRHA